MSEGEWHIVRQGESVESIAARRHQSWESIWQHPENAELRQQRKSPHVLYPGDRLFVPELRLKQVPLATEQRHSFRLKASHSKLRIRFLIGDKSRANEQYTFRVDDGPEITGSTDGDGWFERAISSLARRVVISFPRPDAQNGEGQAGDLYSFELKGLDPSNTVSGAQARLHALGYGIQGVNDELDDYTRDALLSFQSDTGLNPSGELDSSTQQLFSEQEQGGKLA